MIAPVVATPLLSTAQTSPVSVPLQILNNHVVVSAKLDGAGPYRFIVDSGAGNVVDTAVAAAIGTRLAGHIRLGGVGSAEVGARLTTIRRVAVGAATFRDERFVVTATRAAFAAAEGPRVDGILGRQILASGVTIIDYARRRLTFHAGADRLRGGAAVLPVTFGGGEPHVPCTLRGLSSATAIASSCALDTGSRLNVTIFAPFGKDHPALLPPSTSAVGVDGYGIGGAVYGRLGRLGALSFGALTLDGVVADFSVAQRGAFAAAGVAANVGGGVLRRFTVVFDLPHRLIALRPNADFDAPYQTDRSGLFLITHAGTVTVLDVRPRTPAARAGIVRGDRIVAAQGRAVRPGGLPALRALLGGPADSRISLRIARAGEPQRTIAVRLSDYL